MKKSLKGGSPRRGTPPVAALPSSSSSSEVKQDQSEGPDRDMGHTNMAYNTAEERVTAPVRIAPGLNFVLACFAPGSIPSEPWFERQFDLSPFNTNP